MLGSIPEFQASLDVLYPSTQVSNFLGARGVNGMKSREVLIDRRQTRLDTRKPLAHLPWVSSSLVCMRRSISWVKSSKFSLIALILLAK